MLMVMYAGKVMDTDRGLSRQDATLLRVIGGMLRYSEATLHLLPSQVEQSCLRHCKAGRWGVVPATRSFRTLNMYTYKVAEIDT